MARITYQNRLFNIINNPYCSARDKDFAGDLLTYYKRNRTLSSGRVRCVKEMEKRYSPEACEAWNAWVSRDLKARDYDQEIWFEGCSAEEVPAEIRRLLGRLHINLGHPSNEDLARTLMECTPPPSAAVTRLRCSVAS